MSNSYYDMAQICRNGHVITSMAQSSPQSKQKFFSKCGEETVTACDSRGAPIRGYYHVPGVIAPLDYQKPAYCYNCGSPYSWTVKGIEAASELADELEGLTDDEKAQLKNSLPDLVNNSARRTVAEIKFKKIMKKAGSQAIAAMKEILFNVVNETVKKSLFGG
ncbi:DUF2321 domain-containing protein [Desulfosoma caldarium]|uniref:Uncharacterized protein n=1 Tax=Desulfosoma caldarium TaxID=610254 RepID=A0A3N1UQR3_9BACT|nr:DUF2321 domain-containing protein [Desulfosoma caldarium]ROQ90887.1 hypothetical protein EDC27_2148 [Desulfosoma caldarium]